MILYCLGWHGIYLKGDSYRSRRTKPSSLKKQSNRVVFDASVPPNGVYVQS